MSFSNVSSKTLIWKITNRKLNQKFFDIEIFVATCCNYKKVFSRRFVELFGNYHPIFQSCGLIVKTDKKFCFCSNLVKMCFWSESHKNYLKPNQCGRVGGNYHHQHHNYFGYNHIRPQTNSFPRGRKKSKAPHFIELLKILVGINFSIPYLMKFFL